MERRELFRHENLLFMCVDIYTFRGCSSSISLPHDYKLMTTCDQEYCNDQIYPADRLVCYKCTGSDCSAPSGNSRPCLNYMAIDECYTSVLNETETTRGCLTDGNFTNLEYIVSCNSSYCNNENSSQHLQCIQCTSNDTSECAAPMNATATTCEINATTTCEINYLLGRDAFCYIYRDGGIVERGCSTDAEFSQSSSNDVTKCKSTNCNNECVEQGVCYVCSSTSDTNCLANLNGSVLNKCASSYSCSACLLSDNSIVRGCENVSGNSLHSQCYTCGENGCNNQTLKECYTCNTEEDENCNENGTTTTQCLGNCIVKVTNQTTTERGCQTEDFGCDPSDLFCKECKESLCNNDEMPNPGIKCYQCNGDTPCMYLNSTDKPTVCPNFGASRCFQYLDGNQTMIRGCRFGSGSEACSEANERCVICNTPGCNSIPYLRPSNQSCIECSNDVDCPWGFDASSGKRCNGSTLYNEQLACYTMTFGGISPVVSRGCATDIQCLSSGVYCDYCNEDNCNIENTIGQLCMQCSSENNGTCCLDGTCPSSICHGSVITYEQRGCYMLREDGEMKRGCGTGDDLNQCSICNNLDGCNNKTLTRCYSCDSASNKNCVHPNSSQDLSTTLCMTNCIETILDGEHMVRGCESSELNCDGNNATYCNTCNASLCNDMVKPLGNLECYHCGHESPCESVNETGIMPTPCMYNEPNDKCVQFLENMTMIRGCLSDVIGAGCLNQSDKCYQCDESGCNGLPLFKEATLSCIQCSATIECVWGFEPSAGSRCKDPMLFWQNETCFTNQFNETSVSRGCTLDSGCSNCEECSTNNCNNENHALQFCIQCNSHDNSSCVSGSSLGSSACPAKVQTYENRGCYVLQKVDSHTFRGCSSSLVLPEDYLLQEKCNFEYCNNLIYPQDRRQCYKCEGVNCSSAFGNTRPCLNYVENDQCYTNVFTSTNTTRGCISDGNATMTSFTVTCDRNNCNNRPSTSTLSCTKCNSVENKDCVRSPQPEANCTIPVVDTCTVYPLLGRNDSCYVERNGDLVKRGCYSVDFGAQGPEEDDSLNKCQTNMCNNQCLPEVTCFKCNSSADPNCASDLSQLVPQTCEDYSLSTCYGCLNDDGIVTRGCGSSNLTEGCLSCGNGDGCNNFQIRYCYNCSSADDPNCAQLTDPGALGTKVCHSECMTTVVGLYTMRGCATDFQACEEDDPSCKTCAGALCNNAIVPAERLHCYHCNGSTPCLNITSKNEVSLPCANYIPNDKCMAYLSKNSIIRGCISDQNAAECIDAGNKCLTCSTPNCNGAPLLRAPELLCIACYYISECSWGFDQRGGRRCRGDVAFYQNESCFTYQYSDGSISRGCTLEGGCDPSGSDCKICSTDNCNNENMVYQSCIQCDSDSSGDCSKESDGSSATRCPGDIQTYQTRGCYVWQRNGKVTRGCISELSAEDRYYCKSESNEDCSVCLDQACNKQEAGNSAHRKHMSTVIISFLLFVSLKFSN